MEANAANPTRHLPAAPAFLRIFITMRCNLQCPDCAVGGDMEAENARRELTTAEWAAFIDEVAAFKPYVYFAGGEPLLRKDLPALVARVRAHGLSCGLTTNGWLLDRHAEALVDAGLSEIWVSLDGPAESHDRFRARQGTFEAATAGLRALRDARERAGRSEPKIFINAIIDPRDLDAVRYMARIWPELGADALNLQHVMFYTPEVVQAHLREGWRGGLMGGMMEPSAFDSEAISALLSELAASEQPPNVQPTIGSLPAYYSSQWPSGRSRCQLLWRGLTILPDGEMTTCVNQPMGNVRDTPVAVAWRSAELEELRGRLAGGRLLPKCYRCCYNDFQFQ